MPDRCPICGAPVDRVTEGFVIWTCGVATSRAYHHEATRSACTRQEHWAPLGEEAPR